MKSFIRSLLTVIFSVLFSVFVFLSSLNFQLLNREYLLMNFEKRGLYDKLPAVLLLSVPNDPNLTPEEKEGITALLTRIPPQAFEIVIKDNLTNILNYIWGKDKVFTVLVPAKELGMGQENILWSPEGKLEQQFSVIEGAGQKLLLLWYVLTVLLILCYFVYTKSTDTRGIFSGYRLLITNGVLLLTGSLTAETAFLLIPRTFPPQPEPSQAIITLLFSDLLPYFVLVWVAAGGIVTVTGLIMRSLNKTHNG